MAKKFLDYKDIKSFTRGANYRVDIPLDYIIESLDRYKRDYNLDMDPDFQRAHVWNEEKQVRFIEFILRSGQSSREIYFNCPNWMGLDNVGPMVLVDGKQRLEAIRRFMADEIEIFGGYKMSETDRRCWRISQTLKFNINNLDTRAEVLQWYLDINDGGVIHTSKEIQKVRDLLAAEK
jgi:hypothetical protein